MIENGIHTNADSSRSKKKARIHFTLWVNVVHHISSPFLKSLFYAFDVLLYLKECGRSLLKENLHSGNESGGEMIESELTI